MLLSQHLCCSPALCWIVPAARGAPRPAASSMALPARLGESGRSARLPVTQLGWISRLSALHPSFDFRLSSLNQ